MNLKDARTRWLDGKDQECQNGLAVFLTAHQQIVESIKWSVGYWEYLSKAYARQDELEQQIKELEARGLDGLSPAYAKVEDEMKMSEPLDVFVLWTQAHRRLEAMVNLGHPGNRGEIKRLADQLFVDMVDMDDVEGVYQWRMEQDL